MMPSFGYRPSEIRRGTRPKDGEATDQQEAWISWKAKQHATLGIQTVLISTKSR